VRAANNGISGVIDGYGGWCGARSRRYRGGRCAAARRAVGYSLGDSAMRRSATMLVCFVVTARNSRGRSSL